MQVFVSDTSVIIDLNRGGLLEQVFTLPYEFVVPDVLYKRELENYEGPRLQELGLRVEPLNNQEVEAAIRFRQHQSKLSVPDSFALSLAKSRKWVLLSGDADLRDMASREIIECHGVLWLFDQMELNRTIAIRTLKQALNAIVEHPRCRLPRTEVRQRQQHYEKITRDENNT